MAKQKTQEEKIAFINAHLSLVPNKGKKSFESKDVDGQYTKILGYLRKSNKVSEEPAAKKINVKNIVKHITSLNPSTKQIESIVTELTQWVNDTKSRKKEELQKKIDLLQKEMENL